ncbi:MAG TPA: hypothetical protein PK906_17930, partial [Spirochaetota bacterium]|nr:hypothetical protein [Spirochaetota bacterium]
LKEKFSELNEDREKALNELSRLRELKEQQVARDEERGQSELLNHIRSEMEKLNSLKSSLDNLHSRFDEMAELRIPEARREPAVIEARYEAPIPVHFDPKPVLEILEKLNQKMPEPEKEKLPPAPEPAADEITEEQFTEDELKQLEEPESSEDIPEFEEPGPADDLTLDEIEGFEEEITPEEEARQREEELFPEPEIFPAPEPAADEVTEEQFTEDELKQLEEPESTEDIPEFGEPEPADDLTLNEIEGFEEEVTPEEEARHEEELFPEPEEDAPPTPPAEETGLKKEPEEDTVIPEELLQKEKEKEIERYTEGEEDANDFDLISEYGKTKDDSTLTDEDIFEKILKDDQKKTDDSQFEILGDRQNEEPEYSFDDSRLDEKKKNDLDFYKKFIKPDRIKKRELPILRVSYDFKKLPDEFSLSREKNILEYSFYKYKPMLQKADEFIKHRQVRDAINYYKVVADQNIPVEFKAMIRKNIRDLTEYLEKYLSSE